MGNTIEGSLRYGLNASILVGYGSNVIYTSIYGGSTVNGSPVEIGTNVCDGNPVCP